MWFWVRRKVSTPKADSSYVHIEFWNQSRLRPILITFCQCKITYVKNEKTQFFQDFCFKVITNYIPNDTYRYFLCFNINFLISERLRGADSKKRYILDFLCLDAYNFWPVLSKTMWNIRKAWEFNQIFMAVFKKIILSTDSFKTW